MSARRGALVTLQRRPGASCEGWWRGTHRRGAPRERVRVCEHVYIVIRAFDDYLCTLDADLRSFDFLALSIRTLDADLRTIDAHCHSPLIGQYVYCWMYVRYSLFPGNDGVL
jgi:hypothetical protein